MLTIAEIVNQTCPDASGRAAWRSSLNRLLRYPEIRTVAKGKSHPQYPEEAIGIFHRLYDLKERGYEPKEIARRLQEEFDRRPVSEYPVKGQPVSEQPATPSPGGEMMVLPRQASDLLAALVEQIAAQAGDRLSQQLLPPIEDRLIRADAAADLLACGAGSVHQQLTRWGVEPVALRPRRWRRSDVLRALARL